MAITVKATINNIRMTTSRIHNLLDGFAVFNIGLCVVVRSLIGVGVDGSDSIESDFGGRTTQIVLFN